MKYKVSNYEGEFFDLEKDCCTHYNSNTFTKGFLANDKTQKVSKFPVYICDNCGEVHEGSKNKLQLILSILYFKFISKGCIFVKQNEKENPTTENPSEVENK